MSSLRLALKLSLEKMTERTGASSTGGADGGSAGDGKKKMKKKKRKQSNNSGQEKKEMDDNSRSCSSYNNKKLEKWNEMFQRLQEFRKDHNGSCDVPRPYEQDLRLGNWVHSQRQNYKKGLLAKEQRDQLDAVGFQWILRLTGDYQWNAMFQKLRAYQRTHQGSSNVPQQYHSDPTLGYWVQTQRKYYKIDQLAKSRHDRLEALGFQWKIEMKDYWSEMFERLRAYQRDHDGCCNVPGKYRPDPKLGNWVVTQRQRYRTGQLSKDRRKKLEAIGFQWTAREHRETTFENQWKAMFQKLQAYQKEHGGKEYKEYIQDRTLRHWVSTQRKNYKKGTLTKCRHDKLVAIGFQWTGIEKRETEFENQWMEMFQRLQAYRQEHGGSFIVPSDFRHDPKLARWVQTQRKYYADGTLAKNRYDQLNAIGFCWPSRRKREREGSSYRHDVTQQKLEKASMKKRSLHKLGNAPAVVATSLKTAAGSAVKMEPQPSPSSVEKVGETEPQVRRWCWL